MNNSVFDEYVNCPKLKVSVLLWGKTSKKILKWLKEHESDHHYRKVAKGIGLNSKKGYETVGRILRRLRKKGLVSTPMAPTIIYKEGSPCSGPLKPKRGYFQFPDSKAVLESVPKVPCFDMKDAKPCLMLHNLTWCWRGPPGSERWKVFLDRGFFFRLRVTLISRGIKVVVWLWIILLSFGLLVGERIMVIVELFLSLLRLISIWMFLRLGSGFMVQMWIWGL